MPDDLMTSVRTMAPTLLVAADLVDSDVSALSSAFTIVRWPSREPVASSVSYVPRDEPGGLIVHQFHATPATPLAPGWYAASVDVRHLPAHLAVPADGSPWPGHLLTRFAPHQTTIVSELGAELDGGETIVTVRFSARVHDTRPVNSLLTLTDGTTELACVSDSDAALGSEDGTYEIVLRCSGDAPALHLEIDPSLHSLNGVALIEEYGGPAEFDIALGATDPRIGTGRALGL